MLWGYIPLQFNHTQKKKLITLNQIIIKLFNIRLKSMTLFIKTPKYINKTTIEEYQQL